MSITVDISVGGTKCMTLTIHGEAEPGEMIRAENIKGGLSLNELIEPFLESVDRDGKSQSTMVAYRAALVHFAGWLVDHGISALLDITPRHISDWKHCQQVEQRARPATINLKLTAISRFFQWAMAQGLLQNNPASEIKQLNRGRLRPKALTEQETQALLDAARQAGNLRDIAIVELMLGCGLRVSEVLGLCLADLELSDFGGKVIIREGKGGKFREIPLPLLAGRAIQAYLVTIEITRDKPIWRGTRGALSTGSAIKKILARLATEAGITKIYPHMLRHTFASRYLAANPGDMRGLASLMGHSSLNTTMIYTEPKMSDLAKRVQLAAGSR